MAARAAREAEMLEPWRKNFPICKPYAAHDKADAVRFLRELEEGCDGMNADIDYTLGEVIRGVHRGGNNAAAPPTFGATTPLAPTQPGPGVRWCVYKCVHLCVYVQG